MKFLLIGSFALSLIKFRRNLIETLIVRGLEVHVVLPFGDDDRWIITELENSGVVVHEIDMARTGMNPFNDLVTFLKLLRLMRKIRPSHVLSYTIKPVVYGSIAARLAGVKNAYALVTGLGYAFEKTEGRGRLRGLAQRMYKLALGRVVAVVFQNPDDELLFREKGLIAANCRTFVVNGSGVDLDEFQVAAFPAEISFLVIARLLGAKGIREFVAAARVIHAKGLKASFKIVGWIDDNPDAVSVGELEAWKAEGVVEFLGKKNDVRPAISDCTVYVLPSYREGTPRTVLEALAMGRPVITTDVPGCRETVLNGENGFLVPAKSVDELATAMCRFLDDPHLAVLMGKRSRAIAENRFDVHKVNEAMLVAMDLN